MKRVLQVLAVILAVILVDQGVALAQSKPALSSQFFTSVLRFGAGNLYIYPSASTTLATPAAFQAAEFVAPVFRNGSNGPVSFGSYEPNGATAASFRFNTEYTLSTAGAEIARFSNNTTKVASISYNGDFMVASASGGFGLDINNAPGAFGMAKSGSDLYLSTPVGFTHWIREGNSGEVRAQLTNRGVKLRTVAAASLPECGDGSPTTEAIEGMEINLTGAGGTYTKKCICQHNGSGTYRWYGLTGGGAGNATTCP